MAARTVAVLLASSLLLGGCMMLPMGAAMMGVHAATGAHGPDASIPGGDGQAAAGHGGHGSGHGAIDEQVPGSAAGSPAPEGAGPTFPALQEPG